MAIQEIAPVEELFKNPLHPYTKALMKSIPHLDTKSERLYSLKGMVPSFLDMPIGCKFCTRCDFVEDKCKDAEPELIEMKDGHFVRCNQKY